MVKDVSCNTSTPFVTAPVTGQRTTFQKTTPHFPKDFTLFSADTPIPPNVYGPVAGPMRIPGPSLLICSGVAGPGGGGCGCSSLNLPAVRRRSAQRPVFSGFLLLRRRPPSWPPAAFLLRVLRIVLRLDRPLSKKPPLIFRRISKISLSRPQLRPTFTAMLQLKHPFHARRY